MPYAIASAGLATSTSTSAMTVSLSSSDASADTKALRSTFLQTIGFDGYCSSPLKSHRNDPSENTHCETATITTSRASHHQVGECILRLEPLKIALESDDETSVGSSCDDSDPTCVATRLPLVAHHQDTTLDYFHKQPYSRSLLQTTTQMASTCQEKSDSFMEDCSRHSLPSLIGSDVSSISSSSLSSSSSSLSRYPSNLLPRLSNKKPRYLGQPHSNIQKKRKSVSIHKAVSVVSIPSRFEYSQRIRERIWTTASEIHANAARNAIEFCSENWKWENALEDHQMFIHQGNGERVHPIHVHNAISLIDSFQGDPRKSEEIHFNLSLIAALVPPSSVRSLNSDVLSSVFNDDQQQPTQAQLQPQVNDTHHDQACPDVSPSSPPSAAA